MARTPPGRPHADARAGATGLRGRLANRPDSEHEQAIIRLVIVVLLGAYFGILALTQADATGRFATGALFACGYGVISLGYIGWIIARPAVCRPRRLLGMVTDHTTLSVLLSLGGPWGGALYPIYLWITFGNGFRYGNAYLAAAAGYSVVAFAVAGWINPFWHDHVPLTVGLALGLVVLPTYVASLIRKLTEAKRHAEAANRAKSRFLATMSHELRTPLNAVIGLSDLLNGGRLAAEQREMVQTIGSSGRALLALINDVLDLAKIEAGKEDVQAVDFDLVAELANSVAILRPEAEGKGLKAGLVIEAGVPARVRGDVRHLRQVLLNLLSNAVKFTETGGVVLRVGCLGDGEHATLSFRVEDTGIGISDADQARIFDAFTQSDEDTGRRHGGTGLGLAIARHLVELMGGRLTVASTPGRGSAFGFELPVERIEPAPAAARMPVRLVAPGPGGSDDLMAAIRAAGAMIAAAEGPDHVVVFDLRHLVPGQMPDGRLLGRLTASAATARGCIIAAPDEAEVMRPLGWAFGTAIHMGGRADGDLVRAALDLLGAVVRRDSSEPVLPDEAALDQAGPRAKVLVVEDNAVNAKVTAKILERGGHEAVIVDSGDAALERLEVDDIDAVLMDVNMPGDNGIDTAKLLRFTEFGAARRLPIIALTADATVDTRDACFEAGMDDYVTKPVDAANLLRVLAAHLPDASGEAAPAENAPQPLPAAEEPVIDRGALQTLLDLDASGDFLVEVVEDFRRDVEALVEQIDTALETKVTGRAEDLLHALGSAAGYMGAVRVRNRARRLEQELRRNRLDTVRENLTSFQKEVEDYRAAILTSHHAARSADGGGRVISLPTSSR